MNIPQHIIDASKIYFKYNTSYMYFRHKEHDLVYILSRYGNSYIDKYNEKHYSVFSYNIIYHGGVVFMNIITCK